MKVQGKNYRSIWLNPHKDDLVHIIDQRYLPHQFIIADITTSGMMVTAIKEMWLRGAGLIGAAAAFGMYLAAVESIQLEENSRKYLIKTARKLIDTRPTAVNLKISLDKMLNHLLNTHSNIISEAKKMANKIADEDAEHCRRIGLHGLKIIEEISNTKEGKTVNILTHCNAGWLAFVDYGSALAPVYAAFNKGIKVHVWVDETRPRNQGSKLTAWELQEHGIPYTIITDNTGGHLMQHKKVDLVIVGSDRCTRNGDIANKIGTYLKALAAYDNKIPFYAALPSSTIDWDIKDGVKQIPIEQRGTEEVKYMSGLNKNNIIEDVLICPKDSPSLNYGFDVTPARLISGIITERGVAEASERSLVSMFAKKTHDG